MFNSMLFLYLFSFMKEKVATSEHKESKKYSWVKDDIWFHLCIIYSVMSSSPLCITVDGRRRSSRAVCLCAL